MTKVLCFGTFDLLHIGHLHYFQQAKKQGTHLTVVIARDKTNKKSLIFSEQERLKLIQNLKIVDQAILGYHEDHFKIIEELKPDIIFLGYDHPKLEDKLARFPAKILRGTPYKESTQKSSKIKDKLNL